MNKSRVYSSEEEYEAAAIKLAISRSLLQEKEEAVCQLTSDEQEMAELMERETIQQAIQRVEKELGKQKIKNSLKSMLRPAAAVVLIVLVLNFALTVAVAANQNIRVKVVQFFESMNESYAEYGYVQTGETLQIPEDWTEHYYLSYIPEGYEISNKSIGETISTVEYSKNEEDRIFFGVFGIHEQTNLDVENAMVSVADINGSNATVIEKEGTIRMVWCVGNCYFVLITTEDYATTRDIAQSVTLIQK